MVDLDASRRRNAFESWSYMLVYVDNCLLIDQGQRISFEERDLRMTRSTLGSEPILIRVWMAILIDRCLRVLFEGSIQNVSSHERKGKSTYQ